MLRPDARDPQHLQSDSSKPPKDPLLARPTGLLGLDVGPPHDYGPRLGPVQGRTQALIVIGAVIVGFLLATSLVAGRDAARVQDLRRGELVSLIGERQAHAEALSQRRDELRAEVAQAEATAAADLHILRGVLEDLETLAGAAPVQGPGVRLTLTDAEQCADQTPENCRILDTDLQAAVNTLFGVGAEAIAVNGERVIATTALRNAGSTITVNYRAQISPYQVEAVGDPAALERGLADSVLGRNFTDWSDAFGLGFSVQPADALELPAYRGSLMLQTARVPGGRTP